MTGRVQKIPIAEQISAVSISSQMVRAAAEYRDDRHAHARADALDAAIRTLVWVRDNADRLRAAVPPGGHGERRRFADLPFAQQSAMRCTDVRFQKFMRVEDADGAARAVRSACRVASRKQLDEVREAGNAWRKLDAEFEGWLRGEDVMRGGMRNELRGA